MCQNGYTSIGICFQRISQRECQYGNYITDFVEGTMLPKPTKVYLLSLAERNSLDIWINEELRKGYI